MANVRYVCRSNPRAFTNRLDRDQRLFGCGGYLRQAESPTDRRAACSKCGYDTRATINGICPERGTPTIPPRLPPPSRITRCIRCKSSSQVGPQVMGPDGQSSIPLLRSSLSLGNYQEPSFVLMKDPVLQVEYQESPPMPIKIAMIGAGSIGFTRRLMRHPRRAGVGRYHLRPDRYLATTWTWSRSSASGMRRHNLPAKIVATTDRRAAIADADYVICMIRQGGLERFKPTSTSR